MVAAIMVVGIMATAIMATDITAVVMAGRRAEAMAMLRLPRPAMGSDVPPAGL